MAITWHCTMGHGPEAQNFSWAQGFPREGSACPRAASLVALTWRYEFCIGGSCMLGELGLPEILLILGIALLLFGPKKLGDLGKSLGEGIRSFRSAIKEEPHKPAPESPENKPAS
jgi:sec-independent protein translocase protein TatA